MRPFARGSGPIRASLRNQQIYLIRLDLFRHLGLREASSVLDTLTTTVAGLDRQSLAWDFYSRRRTHKHSLSTRSTPAPPPRLLEGGLLRHGSCDGDDFHDLGQGQQNCG